MTHDMSLPLPASGLRERGRGFTVIEMMVVVAVLAVLAAAAIPTFIEVMNNNRLAARSNDVVSMLQNARLEAIRSGSRVIVCPTVNGTACASGSTWGGWIAFVDRNGNNALDTTPAPTELLLSELVPAPMQMKSSSNISGGTGRIIFRPDGLVYRADGTSLLSGALSICLPTRRPVTNARDIVIRQSRISVAAPRDATDACTVPSNP